MTVEIGALIALIGFLISAAAFFIGRTTAAKTDGERQGALYADISYIKEELKNLSSDIKAINVTKIFTELQRLSDENLRFQKSIKRLHSRIDEHLKNEHDKAINSSSD